MLWDYVLFSGDRASAVALFPALVRSLDYLLAQRGPDGLIRQRWATSKHAGNLNLGDVGRPGYLNILTWSGLQKASRLAEFLDCDSERSRLAAAAESLAAAIQDSLWNDAGGFFQRSVEQPVLGHEASSLALASGLATAEQAARLVGQLGRHGHGKFQSLMARGKLQYGYADAALHDLFAHGWRQILEDDQLVFCCTECMGTDFFEAGWGDESHPDTAIAHLMSGWLAGIEPTQPGYRRCRIAPRLARQLNQARATVPTPHGLLTAGWRRQQAGLVLELDIPAGVTASVDVPVNGVQAGQLFIDGQQVATVDGSAAICRVDEVAPGQHQLELRVSAGRVAGLTVNGPATEQSDPSLDWRYQARSSVESGPWGLAHALALRAEPNTRGYSSAAHTQPQIDEWIEIDFGQERPLRSLVLVPQPVNADGDSPGYPLDLTIAVQADHETQFRTLIARTDIPNPHGAEQEIGLYTVVGLPRVRRVRLTASRVAVPAWVDPLEYRWQLRALRLVWAD